MVVSPINKAPASSLDEECGCQSSGRVRMRLARRASKLVHDLALPIIDAARVTCVFLTMRTDQNSQQTVTIERRAR